MGGILCKQKLCEVLSFMDILLSSLMIQAQDNQRISIDLRGETLEAALWYLQNRTKFVFMYGTEDIANVTDITIKAKDKTITEILDECLEGTNLTYEISGSAIVIKKKQKPESYNQWLDSRCQWRSITRCHCYDSRLQTWSHRRIGRTLYF